MCSLRIPILAAVLLNLGGSLAVANVSELEALPLPAQSVYLRWVDLTGDETGFKIERKTGDDDWVEVATLPVNSTVYTDSGLLVETEYSYTVTALTPGTPVGSSTNVTTFSGWNIPETIVSVNDIQADTISFSYVGDNASYSVQKSQDLSVWTELQPSVFVGDSQTVDFDGPPDAFYRVNTQNYERPAGVGLLEPIKSPPPADGEVWDVTVFGSSPVVLTNDDAIGIKVAISIAQPGDVVYIPEGTYTIRQTIYVPNFVNLRGAGIDKTILITEGIDTAIKIQQSVHDVRIEDLSINYLGDTEELQFGVYVGSSRTGFNSTRIEINRIRVEGFSVHGISLRDCHHVLVQDCEILNATNLGGGGHGYGIALNYPTNRNNHILNNTIGPVIRHAVLLQYYSHNNLIEGNTAIANTEDAFDLHGEDEYANELRYNTALDGERDGFGVGNTGSTHDRSGPDNWIHHNTVERCLSGIEVIQGSDVVYIDHNTFSNNEYGVRISNGGGKHTYIRANKLIGNWRGISLQTSQWATIQGNLIENSAIYGIEILNDVLDLVEEDNQFSGNTLDYNP